jgi:hypothetical protein
MLVVCGSLHFSPLSFFFLSFTHSTFILILTHKKKKMSSAYGAIARPLSAGSLGSVLPRHATLRQQPTDQQNSQTSQNQATLLAISKAPSPTATSFTLSASTHATLVNAMHKVFNTEVERGDTYPQEFPLDEEQFANYFLGGDAFVLIKGDYKDAGDVESKGNAEEWDKDLLGFFYVKPNFPVSFFFLFSFVWAQWHVEIPM